MTEQLHFHFSQQDYQDPLCRSVCRWLSGKESTCQAGDAGLIPGLGRFPGGGNGNPPQYSCLGNPLHRGAWQPIVHGATKVGDDWATNPPRRAASRFPFFRRKPFCQHRMLPHAVSFALHLTASSLQKLSQQTPPAPIPSTRLFHIFGIQSGSLDSALESAFFVWYIPISPIFLKKFAYITVHSLFCKNLSALTNTQWAIAAPWE